MRSIISTRIAAAARGPGCQNTDVHIDLHIQASFHLDLKTNRYDWYQPVNVVRSADGAWDEPPKFPSLTNAYFQSLEAGKDELLGPFKK